MEALPRRMHTMGSKKDLEYASDFLLALIRMSIFGMLDILPFHVNHDYNEGSCLNDKQRVNASLVLTSSLHTAGDQNMLVK